MRGDGASPGEVAVMILDAAIARYGERNQMTPTIAGEEAERWIRFSAWPM